MSKANTHTGHGMQGVFVFVLLGLFALMSTLMVLLGAQMYRGAVNNADENNENRLLGAYVRSMVRAEDAAQALAVEEHDGVKALAMYEDIEDERYVTWLYLYEGQLYEQFTEADYEFTPDAGTAIAPANRFEPALEGGMLVVDMADEQDVDCGVRIALRCPQQ